MIRNFEIEDGEKNNYLISRTLLDRIKNEHGYVDWTQCGLNIYPETQVHHDFPRLAGVIKDETNKNTSGTLLDRIKIEHNYVCWSESFFNEPELKLECIVTALENGAREVSHINLDIKQEDHHDTSSANRICYEHSNDSYVEENDCFKIDITDGELNTDNNGGFKLTEITEELILKSDEDESLAAVAEIDLDRNELRTSEKCNLIPKKPDKISFSCYNCDYATYKKCFLEEHMKNHNQSKYTHKIFTCRQCRKKLKDKVLLDLHMKISHPSSITRKSRSKNHNCSLCKTAFNGKLNLNEHIVRKHPGLISSITNKVYECVQCSYKTLNKKLLDQHVVRVHPDCMESVTTKLYECEYCAYKSVRKVNFDEHVSRHFGVAPVGKPTTCQYCQMSFKSKRTLDDHVVKLHPSFATSVSSKTYQCIKCGYKTTRKHHFDRHISVHPQTNPSCVLTTCIHCNKEVSTAGFDEHVVKKHPEFIVLVTNTVYDCSRCTYKTTIKKNFDKHLSAHPV